VQRHRRRGSQTKRNAFRSFLKRKDEFMSRTEAGRVFQTRGPAMLNDRSAIAVRDLGTFDANQRTVGRWTGTMEHGRLVTDYCITHIQGYTSNQSVPTGHIHGPHQTPVTVNKITRSLTRLSKQLTLQSTTLSTTTLPLCCLFLR